MIAETIARFGGTLRALRCAVLLSAALTASACTRGVTLRPVADHAELVRLRERPRGDAALSFRTEQLLRRFHLDEQHRKDPGVVLARLDAMVRLHPDRDLVYALAELHHQAGRKLEKASRSDAIDLYLRSVAYAYYYLFDPAVVPQQANVFDPRFRGACDLYNESLTRCLRLAQKEEIHLADSLRVERHGAVTEIRIRRRGFQWANEDFDFFRFARDFEIDGLTNQYQTFGLGVPLIAVRKKPRTDAGPQRYYPEELGFPATAFLRMEGSVCDAREEPRIGTLDLVDPLHVQTLEVGGRRIPLESDLSTPLAYFLSQFKPEQLELTGFLRGEQVQSKEGLYLLQPYEPGKIPVVMVHGLWSSPMAWMPMFNDLRGDPALRDRYQFWFYMYPTGNPIPFSAERFRRALDEARATLDPKGVDPGMKNLVVVGHSMGGLLAKTLVQESRDELWKEVSKQPLELLDVDPLAKDRLRSTFFYSPKPYVGRVVFLTVPHRGSTVSQSMIGRLGSKLIVVPRKIRDLGEQLLARNPNAATPLLRTGLGNSVDDLAPGSPVLMALDRMPMTKTVPYHTILGKQTAESMPKQTTTDGVVDYGSGHLEGVQSEYLIPDGHNCLGHPLAILEVRRILLEHLKATDPTGDQPVSTSERRETASTSARR